MHMHVRKDYSMKENFTACAVSLLFLVRICAARDINIDAEKIVEQKSPVASSRITRFLKERCAAD